MTSKGDIVNCSICKREGLFNERKEGKLEIRKILLSTDDNLICKECYSKATRTPLEECKPVGEYGLDVVVLHLSDLLENPCQQADCIGCNPQNFNEKGEFQKERLH